MVRFVLSLVLLVACAAAPAARQTDGGDALVGTWKGTYDGAGTGQYSMTVARDDARSLGGSITVSSEVGGYTAKFKSVEVSGATATLKYDFPDSPAEMQLTLTLDGKACKGTWKAVDPQTATVMAEGTMSGSKG